MYQSRHLRRLAAATAERLKGDIPLDQPDLVLWQVGTNDALAKVPADAFKATVQNTVQWLKERRIDTVLVGLQESARGAPGRGVGRIR